MLDVKIITMFLLFEDSVTYWRLSLAEIHSWPGRLDLQKILPQIISKRERDTDACMLSALVEKERTSIALMD